MAARAEAEDVTLIKSAPLAPASEDPTVPSANSSVLDIDLDFNLDVALDDTQPGAGTVDRSVFRAYDIRGVVGETLTEDSVYEIGRALGAEAESRGQKTVVVARDGRHSSEPFMQALTKGLLESGRDVLDIGLAPTPVLYFATNYLDAHSGVMITGSHNPAQYNGLKIVLDGQTLSGEAIQAIRRRVDSRDYIEGTGSMQSTDIVAEYIRRISEEIPVSLGDALKVVVDCGNGVPGMVAPAILRAIGHDVVELFCDVDGDFPNHHPDPSLPENLQQLIAAVQEEGADLGLAFDGDGDRLGVVDAEGNIIWPDRQMILFARDVLTHNPGAKVIYDVKCSRHLPLEIEAAGGEPVLSKTGHSIIKNLMQESGAMLAGEFSGHIFFRDRWYGFDDALYAAARLLEILVNSGKTPAEVFAELPGGHATPELRLDMPESRHAEFMDQVMSATEQFEYAEINTLDGMRADFVDSWGLIRPSNTTPCLTLRFEGDDAESLEDVKNRFRKMIQSIDPSLKLPF
ncbi:MAG: phosphomannomutase/phosphoglucomutase [Gammaproteobacteria bacterium]|nr:phosphomannomutase/phosphoglucomutase [Gammaproteobacteria bacterium]